MSNERVEAWLKLLKNVNQVIEEQIILKSQMVVTNEAEVAHSNVMTGRLLAYLNIKAELEDYITTENS